MRWYLSPLVSGDRRRETLRAMLTQPEVASANARAKDWHKRITILTVMQRADNEMALSYRKGPLGWALRSEIPAGVDPVPVSLPEADAAGRAVAEVSGGRAYATVLDSLLGMGATAHILGGAVLGPDPDSGVVGHRSAGPRIPGSAGHGRIGHAGERGRESVVDDHGDGRAGLRSMARWIDMISVAGNRLRP